MPTSPTMEAMEGNDYEQPLLPSSPCLPRFPSSSSSLLKDISNFKTPKCPSKSTNPPPPSPSPRFFTASNQTPSSRTRLPRPTPLKSASVRRRLKAFELEQKTQLSSRKEQIKKQQSLKSLSKSLTTWLNFLLQNPASCGCVVTDNVRASPPPLPAVGLRKREGGGPIGWRCPKRQRGNDSNDDVLGSKKKKGYAALGDSLREVCSLEDLKERMRGYLSLDSCTEVFDVMTQVVKNIDEGRLKMKSHCPLVTDVGMKEKAMRVLMSYNPIWLRIGLHIIFGGDSLLPDENQSSEQEMTFLKMMIEKQFFSHAGLARTFAYNRMVEGLYRPGYYEALGNVILKRFLLMVLILDRAKSQSALPLKYGIDGVDGGSSLLFSERSNIKSSHQVINDFLSSEVMHGEGNLLSHLVILGYKVSYQQCPLVEYDFKANDLFVDLQDGVRLCRAVQLLLNDSSILMKLIVPSNTHKKHLVNCGIVLKYLKHAGVALHDEDGVTVTEDDIAVGDKELTVSLLWNMFVHLQLPLLINKSILAEEILKICGTIQDTATTFPHSSSPLDMLLNWIQAICKKYDCNVVDFSSLVDGKAIWCLLDYYFRKELHCPHTLEDPHGSGIRESIMSATDYTDAVHNFILSQKLITLLGNFPEVLQISDILEHSGATSDRSVVVLLVFLSSQLIMKKALDHLNFHKLLGCNCQSPENRRSRMERSYNDQAENLQGFDVHDIEDAAKRFKAIKAWWQDMAEKNGAFVVKQTTSKAQCNSTCKSNISIQRDNAAKLIQSHFRRSIHCCKFLKMKKAVYLLQAVVGSWLMVRQNHGPHICSVLNLRKESRIQSENVDRYVKLIVDRNSFVKLKGSVILIQRAARIWMDQRHQSEKIRSHQLLAPNLVNAAVVIQKYYRCWAVRSRSKVSRLGRASSITPIINSCSLEVEAIETQISCMDLISCNLLHNQHLAAMKIQSYFRVWLLRRKFLNQKQAITKLQRGIRRLIRWRNFQLVKSATRSAVMIQSHVRGWIARKMVRRQRYLIGVLQRCCHVWVMRRNFLLQREAVTNIQSAVRCLSCSKSFHGQRHAAIEIQRVFRGQIARKRLLGASHLCASSAGYGSDCPSQGCYQSPELKLVLSSILKLQAWWRGILLLKRRTTSAIVIQSHLRGCLGRQRASRERQSVVVIQSYWKGYLARKESRGQLLDLRLRIRESAKNVDDSMRIINRLIVALSELESMKSISGILHTCITLDTTTQHSQRCCEKLVAAGAIDSLLKLIRSVSRSIPDQEVLKHSLSTIRNLARYPHLVDILVDSRGSIETLLWEMLRNKEEGFFIASGILKKICTNQKGVDAMRRLPALLKRLCSLVEELKRRAIIEKRNPRGRVARENAERRLKEAVELLALTASS